MELSYSGASNALIRRSRDSEKSPYCLIKIDCVYQIWTAAERHSITKWVHDLITKSLYLLLWICYIDIKFGQQLKVPEKSTYSTPSSVLMTPLHSHDAKNPHISISWCAQLSYLDSSYSFGKGVIWYFYSGAGDVIMGSFRFNKSSYFQLWLG